VESILSERCLLLILFPSGEKVITVIYKGHLKFSFLKAEMASNTL
jgi:hypothetical protein